jgi:2-desacetyl-2-hydroxyethyl bacteriochlorophyllide A dehydrogenase
MIGGYAMKTCKKLYFTAPEQVEVQEEKLPDLAPGQVLVETELSAISPGTEMLVYRGEFPRDQPVDSCLPGLEGDFHYPLAYGYACVGQVIELGPGVDPGWLDRLVFSFQPHATHFVTSPETLHPVPESLSAGTAVFLPNMETAVNLVQDAAPLLGERVLVLGQGIVGLLTSALLAEFPLEVLVSCDHYAQRRKASASLGLTASLDPASADYFEQARALLKPGADLTLELSGSPSALDHAIQLTAFSGRIVIGSWYGEKVASLDLGGRFHRSRIKLVSSQVSSIAPDLSGRWDKARRFAVAWGALPSLQPEKWITHRFPLEQAAEAYRLLDQRPGEAIQVVFDYRP